MTDVKSIHSLAQTVESGTVIFEEGTPGGGMIILLSGRLSVSVRGQQVAEISEPGAYVGETSVLTGNSSSVEHVMFTADSRVVMSNSKDTSMLYWEVATGARINKPSMLSILWLFTALREQEKPTQQLL